MVVSAPAGNGGVGTSIVGPQGQAHHVSTPGGCLVADLRRPEPSIEFCRACGKPMDRRVFFPRLQPDEFRCRDSACYASPFFRGGQQVGQGAQGEGVGGLHSKNFGPAPTFKQRQV